MENAKPNKALRIISAILFLLVSLIGVVIIKSRLGIVNTTDTLTNGYKILYGRGFADVFGSSFAILKILFAFIAAICLFRDKSKGALNSIITFSYIQSIVETVIVVLCVTDGISDDISGFNIFGVAYILLFFINAIVLTVSKKKNATVAAIVVSILIVAISVLTLKIFAVPNVIFVITSVLAVMYRKSVLDYEREHPELFEPAAPVAAPAPVPAASSTIGNADTLKKYKELLDEGIITQEEYDLKKKELLNL